LLSICLPHLFLVKMGELLPFGYRGWRREQEQGAVRGKGRSDENRGWGKAGVYLFLLFSGGNKGGKMAKNRRGREEERGERPGEVAPEQTGLLDMMTRDGPEHDTMRRRPHCQKTMTTLGHIPAGT
jgi:hypothetical protein